jgi:biotin transport system substrate-specific component
LQTFFVLLAGAVLGRRLGAASQICYILIGAAGLPIFQSAGFGISYLLGPTAGYLAGFIAAAYAAGLIAGSGKCGMVRSSIAFFTGSAIIYFFGAAWLVLAYKTAPVNAVSIGVLPFIPGDITKALLAAVIYSRISHRTGAIFSE